MQLWFLFVFKSGFFSAKLSVTGGSSSVNSKHRHNIAIVMSAVIHSQTRICMVTTKPKTRKQIYLLAFRKINQNTQEVKNERFFSIDKTKQCANCLHYTLRLTKRQTGKQLTPFGVLYMFFRLSLWLKATYAENKFVHCFVLSIWKSVHFL